MSVQVQSSIFLSSNFIYSHQYFFPVILITVTKYFFPVIFITVINISFVSVQVSLSIFHSCQFRDRTNISLMSVQGPYQYFPHVSSGTVPIFPSCQFRVRTNISLLSAQVLSSMFLSFMYKYCLWIYSSAPVETYVPYPVQFLIYSHSFYQAFAEDLRTFESKYPSLFSPAKTMFNQWRCQYLSPFAEQCHFHVINKFPPIQRNSATLFFTDSFLH